MHTLEQFLVFVPGMLHVLDRSGRLVGASRGWLDSLGYEMDEIVGRPVSELMTPTCSQRAQWTCFPRFLRDGQLDDQDLELVAADGSVRYVRLSAVAVYDDGGELCCCLGCLTDLTEQRRLQAANDELARFAYAVSHDLRQPLRSIAGFAELFADTYGDEIDGDAARYLEHMQVGARRMRLLIESLLALSRAQSAPLVREEVDLARLARSVIDGLRAAHVERRVDVVIADELGCRGDPALLETLLFNLIGNAWKFTRPALPARIEVGADHTGDETVYWVRDNGIGFDMKHADAIFTAFRRLQCATEFEGNGIGLDTVRRIVQRHGGRVWAESEPGRGACFSFTLGADMSLENESS